MNLKLRRSARTPHSEEIEIYDMDVRDENSEPASIGKLDVHFTDEQFIGTMLIWAEYAAGFAAAKGAQLSMTDLIDEILDEISETLGVPAEYGIEVYYPRLDQHEFVSNFDEFEDDDDLLEEFVDEDGDSPDHNGRVH
ncbi:MAG: hypothetical protein ACR2M0_15715 [Chloroflexia bacterium]